MECIKIELFYVDCKNPEDPECLCESCKDYFENGLSLFDEDQDSLESEEDE